MTVEILQNIFEKWEQKLTATMSEMMSATMDKLFLKDVTGGKKTDVKENTLEDRIKSWNKTHAMQKN